MKVAEAKDVVGHRSIAALGLPEVLFDKMVAGEVDSFVNVDTVSTADMARRLLSAEIDDPAEMDEVLQCLENAAVNAWNAVHETLAKYMVLTNPRIHDMVHAVCDELARTIAGEAAQHMLLGMLVAKAEPEPEA